MSIGSQSWVSLSPQVTVGIPRTRRAFPSWALIGLALAIALWGFGYKLSRYRPHLDPVTRLSYAKLWDKHQDTCQILASRTTAHLSQSVGVCVLSAVFQQQSIRPAGFVVLCSDSHHTTSTSFVSLIPFRSPPSPSFLA